MNNVFTMQNGKSSIYLHAQCKYKKSMQQAMSYKGVALSGTSYSNNLSIHLFLFFWQFSDKTWQIEIDAKMMKGVN